MSGGDELLKINKAQIDIKLIIMNQDLENILNVKLNQIYHNSDLTPEGIEKGLTTLKIQPMCILEFLLGVWYRELMEYYITWFQDKNGRAIKNNNDDYGPFYEFFRKNIDRLRKDAHDQVERIEKYRNHEKNNTAQYEE